MTDSQYRKPRLLVLASTYPRWSGDYEPSFVHELNRRLSREFDVTALVPDAPGADLSGMLDGVKVRRYRYAPRAMQTLVYAGGIAANLRRSPLKWLLVPGFLVSQALAAWRLRKDIDLVHAHWLLPQGLVALLLSPWVPFVVTSHGGDLFGLRGLIAKQLKRRISLAAAAMTVVSSAMRDEARVLGLSPRRIVVVPMGVDLQHRFSPRSDVPRSDNELLFVGRLVAKKGLNVLIDALPAILNERGDVRLRIAGFGPEESSLREQARRLGVDDRLEFMGATTQDQLPDLYRRAALLVAPFIRDSSGDQEGLPVVLMEALGCACPVVVGNVAGVKDLLGDDYPEIRVPPGDASALAVAVLKQLRDLPAARRRAEAIRVHLGKRVDWEAVARRYATILKECVVPSGENSNTPRGAH